MRAHAAADAPSEQGPRPPGSSALLTLLRTAWPWLVLLALAAAGWTEIRKVDLGAVRELVRDTDDMVLALLLAATGVNLALGGLYDVVALGPTESPPPRWTRWSNGTLAFAWSNFLTWGPLAGPAIRLWLYRPLGVTTDRARRALGAIVIAFTLGLLSWCGAIAIPLPGSVGPLAVRSLLAAALALTAATAWSRGGLPVLRALTPGRFPAVASLLVVAAADWFVAWLVFHLAVAGSHGGVPVELSLRTFFVGQLIGLLSFVPGGFGSADLYWGLRLSDAVGGHDRIVAGLLLYRTAYYLVPFLVASLVLAGRVIRTGRRTEALLRTVAASYTFVCGAVLLASAASPSLRERATFLGETVPLVLVEVSHGLSVAFGFLLLVVSRGLARGYRSSRAIALVFFGAGAATTFLKGLDYEEAFLSLGAMALLLLFGGAFERRGRLQPSHETMVSLGLFAVLLFAAVGIGSYDAIPGLPAALARFELLAHEERFVRGLLLLVMLATFVALRLGQRGRGPDRLPDGGAIDAALATVARHGRDTSALLVATGDKALFDGGAPDRFIAYRTSGRFLVAYSDPVVAPGGERDLLEAFLTWAADQDREVILYQVSATMLPVAHDFGFTFFKLGEEGVVDLARFDLVGNKAKGRRHAINAAERAGARLEIVSGDALEGRLPELRAVSDAWLRRRGSAEKGFSIGRFDEAYLRRFPMALVLTREGDVAAFANVLEGPRGEEISVDLMRHLPDDACGIPGAMEYLFLRLMLLGKERGFARFNVGMAPLAAVGEARWARPAERLARQFFLRGEAWYNYRGLRRFKEKFDPDWMPRYMAYSRPWNWPVAIASTTMLIAGGWRGWIPARAGRETP